MCARLPVVKPEVADLDCPFGTPAGARRAACRWARATRLGSIIFSKHRNDCCHDPRGGRRARLRPAAPRLRTKRAVTSSPLARERVRRPSRRSWLKPSSSPRPSFQTPSGRRPAPARCSSGELRETPNASIAPPRERSRRVRSSSAPERAPRSSAGTRSAATGSRNKWVEAPAKAVPSSISPRSEKVHSRRRAHCRGARRSQLAWRLDNSSQSRCPDAGVAHVVECVAPTGGLRLSGIM